MDSVRNLFNVKIPKMLAENTVKAKAIDRVVFFDISGVDGGAWTLDLTKPECRNGRNGDVQCSISASDSDLLTIIKDQGKALTFYFQGRIKISGDLTVLARVAPLLSSIV